MTQKWSVDRILKSLKRILFLFLFLFLSPRPTKGYRRRRKKPHTDERRAIVVIRKRRLAHRCGICGMPRSNGTDRPSPL